MRTGRKSAGAHAETWLRAPSRGRTTSLAFDLLTLFFGRLALCVTVGCFLHVALQLGLSALRIIGEVEFQNRDVEQRVGTRRAAFWRLSDHSLPHLLRLGKCLHSAIRDAERDLRAVVVGAP